MTEVSRGRRCLDCAALLNDSLAVIPSDGDLSVCLYCGCVAFFAANTQRFRRPTPEESRALAADERVQRIVLAAALLRPGSQARQG